MLQEHIPELFVACPTGIEKAALVTQSNAEAKNNNSHESGQNWQTLEPSNKFLVYLK